MVEFKLPAIDISLPPMTFDLVRLAELIAYQQAVIDKLDLNLTGTPAENLQTLRTALAEAKKLLDQASALTSLN